MRHILPQMSEPLFRDRRDAGRRLAAALDRFRNERPVVIGLPRGGVPVAYEVSLALSAPLDVLVVRKLGAPLQREFAIGAIAEEGVTLVDDRALRELAITEQELRQTAEHETRELERRVRLFRDDRAPAEVRGRTATVVDDGLATGSTAVAAAQALRKRGAERVVLAVPVAPPGTEQRLAGAFDEVVCLHEPPDFFAVGPCYEEFGQTGDDEVQNLLRAAACGQDAPCRPPSCSS